MIEGQIPTNCDSVSKRRVSQTVLFWRTGRRNASTENFIYRILVVFRKFKLVDNSLADIVHWVLDEWPGPLLKTLNGRWQS